MRMSVPTVGHSGCGFFDINTNKLLIIRKITQLHQRGVARNVETSLCDV